MQVLIQIFQRHRNDLSIFNFCGCGYVFGRGISSEMHDVNSQIKRYISASRNVLCRLLAIVFIHRHLL